LALPRAAVHEDEGLASPAVDVERLDRRGPVALGPRLPERFSCGIAAARAATDDFVGVRHPHALLVLVVERFLVVVEKDLSRHA
jgi:hypothetical protein